MEAGRIELPSVIEQQWTSTCLVFLIIFFNITLGDKDHIKAICCILISNSQINLKLVYVIDVPESDHRPIFIGTGFWFKQQPCSRNRHLFIVTDIFGVNCNPPHAIQYPSHRVETDRPPIFKKLKIGKAPSANLKPFQ